MRDRRSGSSRLSRGRVIVATAVLAMASWTVASPVATARPIEDDRPTATVRVVGFERSSETGGRWAKTDGETHGRLAFLRVDIDAEDASPRSLRRAFARAIGVNLIDHFPRSDDDPGVSLSLRDVDALTALESIIDATSGPSRGTWQVRDGILDIGTRETLATRTAPITRAIEVTDLLIEPPYFVPRGMGAALLPGGGGGELTERKTPRELGAELVESIVTSVEPDAWHPLTDAERADGLPDPVDPRDPHHGRNLDPEAMTPNGARVPIYVQGRWASIRLKDHGIVVRAPAFVMRHIVGLPTAVPPPASLASR